MGQVNARTSLLAFLGFAAALAAFAVLLKPGRPAITHDYLADLNAEALATPADRRAWPRLYAAILAMEPIPEFMTSRHWPFATDPKGATPPTQTEWAAACEFVEANRDHIDMLRDAAAMDALGIIVSDVADPDYALAAARARGYTAGPEEPIEDPPLSMIVLPHLGELRRGARLLATDAAVAVSAKDAPRAIADLRAIFGLADLASACPTLMEDRVGADIELLAHELLAKRLLSPPDDWSDDDLRSLADLFEPRIDAEPIFATDGERLALLDTVQRCYDAEGRMTRAGAELLLPSTEGDEFAAQERARVRREAASRDEALQVLERLLAAAEEDYATPHWQREVWQLQCVFDEIGWETSRHKYAAISSASGLGNFSANLAERLRQRRAASIAIVALSRHRLRHGAFPATLDALDTDLLASPPLDRFAGKPLRWLLTESKALLYSLGNDRDDDGGNPIEEPENLNWLPPGDNRTGRGGLQDGDWVLWRVPRQ